MISIDRQIKDSIRCGEEFDFLNEIKQFCRDEYITMEDINYCLDKYNFLKESKDPYMAKYTAIDLTVKRINEQYY
jgi:hypothetical protein